DRRRLSQGRSQDPLHLDGRVAVLGRAVPARLLRRDRAPAPRRGVIALDVESLDPGEAARRAARGADPFWLTSPGPEADVGIAADFVGCDPVRVVGDDGGRDVDALEEAWRAERRAWAEAGPSSEA